MLYTALTFSFFASSFSTFTFADTAAGGTGAEVGPGAGEGATGAGDPEASLASKALSAKALPHQHMFIPPYLRWKTSGRMRKRTVRGR